MKTKAQAMTAILLVGLTLAGVITQGGQDPAAFLSDDANLAMNDPDQFAWKLFAMVNQPVRPSDGGEIPDQVLWETWAEQTYVYADSCQAPVWPGPDPQPLRGGRSTLVEIIESAQQGAQDTLTSDPFNFLTGGHNLQQVKINRPFFNYVVDHDLWYQEGVIRKASTTGISFPTEALVVKADWKMIAPEDTTRYHWRWAEVSISNQKKGPAEKDTTVNARLGMIAMHIVSKAVPSWVWTTWEHVDNEGRCDYIGCQDDFGVEPAYLAPHREMNGQYPPGRLTPAAQALLKEAGVGPQWQHYRLKGTQVDFTDATGRPTLMGNSVLEPGFSNSSSCMSCHTRATYNASGESLSSILSVKPLEGFVGTPDPSTFYPAHASRGPVTPLFYRTDFMWQLATETKARDGDCGLAVGPE